MTSLTHYADFGVTMMQILPEEMVAQMMGGQLVLNFGDLTVYFEMPKSTLFCYIFVSMPSVHKKTLNYC